MSLVVGAHPQNPSLSLLSRRPALRERLRSQGVDFFVYGAGAHTIPLIRLGALQLAGTGATPPILAKAQGLGGVVFGMSGPRPERGGLVVRADSGIDRLDQLQGRGIALMPVSWHTQFLAAELDAAGLAWSQVRAVELLPATAAEAFEAGLIDALVATDPLLARIEARTPVRLLAQPGQAFSNRSVYWAPPDVIERHPQAVQALVDALAESDRQTAADLPAAAQLLDGLNGHTAAQWLAALSSRPWGVEPPSADFAAEQQAHADVFARFGLVPSGLDVSDTVTTAFAARPLH